MKTKNDLKFIGDMAYFSHSKSLYGEIEESKVYDFIKKHFSGNVICPNRHLGELTDKSDYAKIASNADYIFVWSESNHAELTKGCYMELDAFVIGDIAVNAILIEVFGDTIALRKIVTIHEHDDYTQYDYFGWVESVSLISSKLDT